MAKLLLFSDLHCNQGAIAALIETAKRKQIDVAVGAGDFCNMRTGLLKVIAGLQQLPCPAVLVPGNAETEQELREACAKWKAATILHGNGATLAGIEFYGLGGGVPVTPFGDWSYDFSEQQARELLAGCPNQGLLVSHSPPQGLVDSDSSGRHLGSEAVREAIQQKKPRLVVCGHIHASAGRQTQLAETNKAGG